jgi:WD40 repeat protein/tetratricopeptide (TPR) repeat protein
MMRGIEAMKLKTGVNRHRLGKSLGLTLFLSTILRLAWGQEDLGAAREEAQSYFEADEPRKAVATLVEAAMKNPKDRATAGMLYASIRDHVWHIPQTLPVRHGGPVKALAFSADGARLASGSTTGEVLISTTEPLDEEDAQSRRVTVQHPSEVIGLVFTKDGRRLAVAGKTGPVQVWDVASPPKLVFTGSAPEGGIAAYAACRDANLVAIGMTSGSIQVIDMGEGKVVAEWKTPGDAVRALAFSHNGKKLGVAGGDRKARVYAVENMKLLGPAIAHQGAILAVDFSYDDRYLLTGGEDRVAKLSDIESGVLVMPEMRCGAGVQQAKVSPDGSMIATVLDDWSVLFWDAFSGKRYPSTLREDAAFNDFVWSRAGLRAATASDDGHATLWTMRSGSRRGERMTHDGPVLRVAMSTDSKLLATGSADGLARVWRTNGGMPLLTVRSHLARARTAFYSLDGEHLITASEDHTALHWKSGRLLPFGPALTHRGKVTCAVFDREATRILTCDETGIAQLWDAASGHPEGAPYQHPGPVQWVDFHSDGKRCLTVSGETATVWSLTDRQKPLATIVHPGDGKSELKCARFSPDGKWLVTASTDGTARIWDAATYRSVGVIDRQYPVLCVRFSPDGSRLVVTGEDAQAAVFETGTWKPVGVPVLAPGPVFSAAITEDNQFMVISSLLLDAVQFYEISTGRPMGRGLVIPSQATCVDYLLSDKVVVVACDDGTVRALEAPFVTQDVPVWMGSFTERLIGLKKTGPETFERVESHADQLGNYVSDAARSTNFDFPRLVRWKMTTGNQRNGMPRFTSTIAANIERRVDERSVDALFECYESVSGDPLILGALSLYIPNARQGEFMADMVLATLKHDPLARCFAASTLIQAGRSGEAEAIVREALAEAPQDPRVLRRAAKIYARLQNRSLAVELFEKALSIESDDAETRRAYAWVLYHFNEPAKALEQFRLAQDLMGQRNDDLVAGICLCAAAQKKDDDARSAYERLVAIDPAWKNAAYLAALRGWTAGELRELERVRRTLFVER